MEGMLVTQLNTNTELTDLLTFRYRRNLTLMQLSALTGLSPSTLHRLERGILKPTPRSLIKLMDGLKVNQEVIEQMIRLSAAKYGKPPRVVSKRMRLNQGH